MFEEKKAELRRELELVGKHKEAAEQRGAMIVAQLQALGVDPEPGTAGRGGVVDAQRKDDELASMFDRLSPGELTRLYTTDRETWQRIMDAHEAQGVRKLMGNL